MRKLIPYLIVAALAFPMICTAQVQIPFTVTDNAAQVIIPNCGQSKPTPTVPCVPNFNQVAHSLSYNYTSGSTSCSLTLDGSNDNLNWATLAAGNAAAAQSPAIQTNLVGGPLIFGATLTHPVNPKTLLIISSGIGGPWMASDDGGGNINGFNIAAGSITYTTGVVSITYTMAPPGVPVAHYTSTINSGFSGISYGNGYYTYMRVKLSACSAGGVTAVYTGYQTPLPINVIADTSQTADFTTPVQVSFYGTPFEILGFQCTNSGGSPAFLQLFKVTNAPALGTNFFYQIELPVNVPVVYTGPVMSINAVGPAGVQDLWAGASTTAGGSTAAGTAVNCNFQTNGSGPFYPATPLSP